MAARKAAYREREKARREDLEERFETARKELRAAKSEQVELLKQGATLQTHLSSSYTGSWRTPGSWELARAGPGWDDYNVQVAANMTPHQFLDSWSSFSTSLDAALAAGAVDSALAVVITARESMTTSLVKLRFDLGVNLLSSYTRASQQQVDALAWHAASYIAATISQAQLTLLRDLYPKIRDRLRAWHTERGEIVGRGDPLELQIFTTRHMTERVVINFALRDCLTWRQRAVVAAMHRSFFPNILQLLSLVAELLSV